MAYLSLEPAPVHFPIAGLPACGNPWGVETSTEPARITCAACRGILTATGRVGADTRPTDYFAGCTGEAEYDHTFYHSRKAHTDGMIDATEFAEIKKQYAAYVMGLRKEREHGTV